MYGLNGVDPGSLFAIYVREKVAVSSYKEIEAALETAWRRQHTGKKIYCLLMKTPCTVAQMIT